MSGPYGESLSLNSTSDPEARGLGVFRKMPPALASALTKISSIQKLAHSTASATLLPFTRNFHFGLRSHFAAYV